MKTRITPPFFEIGVKNYLYGDPVLELARAADAAACRYDIDVLFITPYTEIRRVAENTERLIVLAPYMDLLRPGRGMADILPEALKAAGARGVVLNHCEKPLSLHRLAQGIKRVAELEMLSFVCADMLEEVRAAAQLHPDIINPEQSDEIGKDNGVDGAYAEEAYQAIKAADTGILVENAAGIRCGEQVYECLTRGADGVGASSGICLAEDPCRMAEEMIYSAAMAKRKKRIM